MSCSGFTVVSWWGQIDNIGSYHSVLFTEGKQAVINDITSVDDCPRSNRPMAASNAKGQELKRWI